MPCTLRALLRALLVVSALGLQSGCVTSKKYRLAKEGVPPAVLLEWVATVPPAELTLTSLIVFTGPGSWKRQAKWDEYIVRVANQGDQPLRIDSATLVDVLGQPQVPGTEPWKLEALSSSNWDKYGGVGLSLLAGTGGVAVLGVAAFAASGSIMTGAAGGAVAAGSTLAAVAVVAMPIVAAIEITAVAIVNRRNKAAVQVEFDRRRIVLPLTIAPGATAEGSFFFPMTPGPQRLVLKGRAGDAPLELVLELKQLADLHLKPKAAKK